MADQGAGHVAATVRQLKERQPELKVETLIGDFQGKLELVEQAFRPFRQPNRWRSGGNE